MSLDPEKDNKHTSSAVKSSRIILTLAGSAALGASQRCLPRKLSSLVDQAVITLASGKSIYIFLSMSDLYI